MKKFFKQTLIVIAALAVVFAALDFGYLWANLRYEFGQIPKNSLSLATADGQAPKQTVPANIITISSLGIQAPIVYNGQTTESAFQADLAQGVVHYPQTAPPGQVGNCYIFGHSSDFFWKPGKYKNIFALLPRIKVGAKISISDQFGQNYIYTVTKSFSVASNNTSVLSQTTNGAKILTLQTSYPVGTALARWIVVAQME